MDLESAEHDAIAGTVTACHRNLEEHPVSDPVFERIPAAVRSSDAQAGRWAACRSSSKPGPYWSVSPYSMGGTYVALPLATRRTTS
jgi:hypothetical protein